MIYIYIYVYVYIYILCIYTYILTSYRLICVVFKVSKIEHVIDEWWMMMTDGYYFKVDERLQVNSPGMNAILVGSTGLESSMNQKDLNSLESRYI